MPNYRRTWVPGGTFFFTVVTYKRRSVFDHLESRQILGDVVHNVRQRHPFTIDAWVLLPEHLHCIWTLPGDSSNYALLWSLIKSGFSKRAKSLFCKGEGLNTSRLKHREHAIWQRRYWEHLIRNEQEYQAYMDYIHYNPVKHGLVKAASDWPHSTFHRYVRLGIYPDHWCGGLEIVSEGKFGE